MSKDSPTLTCTKRGKATNAYYHPELGWVGTVWVPAEQQRGVGKQRTRKQKGVRKSTSGKR